MSRGERRLTSLLKRFRTRPWQSLPIDRENNPWRGDRDREASIRSWRATCRVEPRAAARPSSLPVRFDTRDARADGGMRQVELSRDRVVLRRAVRGMRMAINVRVNDFLGIAVREADDGQMLVLVHRDPGLSIPLLMSTDSDEIERASDTWGEVFALPRISEDAEQIAEPAARRRRHQCHQDPPSEDPDAPPQRPRDVGDDGSPRRARDHRAELDPVSEATGSATDAGNRAAMVSSGRSRAFAK